MEKHILKICDGPLDGVSFEVPDFVEKLVIQLTTGKTLRYENDVIEGSIEDVVEHRMILTRLPQEFDKELRADEDGCI